MLPQQIIALIIIVLFILKLFSQKRKNKINANEFILWTSIWLVAFLAIIFIKQIDVLLSQLGLVASGINFLIYLSVLALFYFVFKMRLNIAKMDRDLTELSRQVAFKNKEEK